MFIYILDIYDDVQDFLIVIGNREITETELMIPYFQQLYHETKTGVGQKWLMINVTDDAVLEDVNQCIAIRRGKKELSRR